MLLKFFSQDPHHVILGCSGEECAWGKGKSFLIVPRSSGEVPVITQFWGDLWKLLRIRFTQKKHSEIGLGEKFMGLFLGGIVF